MSKLAKILIILIAALIILIAAGYIAVRAYLSPTTMRTIAQKVASEAIDQPVTIGTVGLSFGFKIGIAVHDVSIENKRGFSPGPAVEIERLTLNLKLLPLLTRKVVITSIDITGAKIKLEKNKQGKLNTPDIASTETQGSGWSFSLASLSVNRSTLTFTDAQADMELQVKDIKQHVKIQGSSFALSGDNAIYVTKSSQLPEMVLNTSHDIVFDTVSKDIEIKKLVILYDPIRLTVRGNVTAMDTLDLEGDLEVADAAQLKPLIPAESRPSDMKGSIQAAFTAAGTTKEPQVIGTCVLNKVLIVPKDMQRGIENLSGTFSFTQDAIEKILLQGNVGKSQIAINGSVNNFEKPKLNLTAKAEGDLKDLEGLTQDMQDVKMNGPFTVNATVRGSAEKPTYSGNYTVKNGTIDGIGLAKPITNFQLNGTLQENLANFTKCSGQAGKSDFSFSGTIADFISKPVITIKNTSHTIDLDELLPKPEKGKKPDTKPAPITIKGTTQIVQVTGMDMVFKNVYTAFTYENEIIDLKGCKADAYDGKVEFDFYYNANSPEPYTLTSRMTSVSTKKMLKRFLKYENIEGKMSGVSDFQGKGLTQKEVIANLDAAGNLQIKDGTFNNFPFVTGLLGWLGMKDYKNVPIENFVLYYTIKNGKVQVKDWALSSATGEYLFNGTIGLTGSIDLRVTTTLAKKYSDIVKKNHGDWVLPLDKQGRATIDIIATGQLLSPKFSLDKNKIKDRIKGTVKDEFDKKKKEWENKLKDLLKGGG